MPDFDNSMYLQGLPELIMTERALDRLVERAGIAEEAKAVRMARIRQLKLLKARTAERREIAWREFQMALCDIRCLELKQPLTEFQEQYRLLAAPMVLPVPEGFVGLLDRVGKDASQAANGGAKLIEGSAPSSDRIKRELAEGQDRVSPGLLAEYRWVANNLWNDDASPAGAPSNSGYHLLLSARDKPDTFWSNYRQMDAKVDGGAGGSDYDDGELIDLIEQFPDVRVFEEKKQQIISCLTSALRSVEVTSLRGASWVYEAREILRYLRVETESSE